MRIHTSFRARLFVAVAVALSFAALGFTVQASHSWGSYHWGRTTSSFTLELGSNVSSGWASYLGTTAADWTTSSVLDAVVAAGKTKPRTCKGIDGRVEVCSERYGNNGWLGVAQIWVTSSHITKGVVKLNDFYFDLPTYNTPGWRNLVMCQEVGHTLGLGHVDEDFYNANLGTCMDYSDDPDGMLRGQLSNEHPNLHDYDMLESIYAHLDSVNTVGTTPDEGRPGNGNGKGKKLGQNVDLDDPSAWGQVVRKDARGKGSLYERNLGYGKKLFTFVIWAD